MRGDRGDEHGEDARGGEVGRGVEGSIGVAGAREDGARAAAGVRARGYEPGARRAEAADAGGGADRRHAGREC